jgi:broad specificity phosphatase PhoE
MTSRQVLLVRHTDVAMRWTTRCYGCTDVGLSRAGRLQAAELASKLAEQPITTILHSGLQRAAYLARRLADLKRLVPIADARWQERQFGSWEGRSWKAIYQDTGSAMDGMLTDPHHYRPGGGETTAELSARVLAAWHVLPPNGVTVVVTHGGPIAALRASLAEAPITDILRYRVPTGDVVTLFRGA